MSGELEQCVGAWGHERFSITQDEAQSWDDFFNEAAYRPLFLFLNGAMFKNS